MIELKTFKKILRKNQNDLKQLLEMYLKIQKYEPIVGDGFVYATGDIPILLVAHMDTVHTSIPSQIYCDLLQKVVWSPQGIGGDDRCGVFMILKLLEKFKPHVLFTEDEEKGCIGASKVVNQILKPDVKFIVELDRRGSDDCVFYDCENKKFQEYIESFGFKTAIGSYSDICILSDEWDIASVNLSSGYYDEHTRYEYIKLNDMEKTLERVTKILEDEESEYYDYQRREYIYYNKNHSEVYHDYEDEYGYLDKDGGWHWWGEDSYESYKEEVKKELEELEDEEPELLE